MAINTRFSAPKGVQEVNTTSAAAIGAGRDAQRTERNTHNDLADAASGLANVAVIGTQATIDNRAKVKTSEAAQANADKDVFLDTEGFIQAGNVEKAELIANYLEANESRSATYQATFRAGVAYENRRAQGAVIKDTDANTLAGSGGGYVAWSQEDSGLTDDEYLPLTKEEAGMGTRADYASYMSNVTNKRISPKKFMLQQVAYEGVDNLRILSQATTSDEVHKVVKDVEAENAQLAKDFGKYISSPEMLKETSAIQSKFNTALKLKLSTIRTDTTNAIKLLNDKDNEDIMKQYPMKPQRDWYTPGYKTSLEADVAYRTDEQAYIKVSKDQNDISNTNEITGTDWTDFSKEAEKGMKDKITDYVISNMESGRLGIAGESMIRQNQVDSTRLDDIRENVTSRLSNGKTADDTLNSILELKKTSPAGFNALINDPKERARILAISPLMRVRGIDAWEAQQYILGNPTITAEKLTISESKQLSKLIMNKDNSPYMKEELGSMYTTMASYGLPHKEIMNEMQKYQKGNPYKLDLKQYSQPGDDPSEVESLMEFKLSQIAPEGRVGTFMDPDTGLITTTDSFGEITQVIDGQGLYNKSNTFATIDNYKKANPVKTKLQSMMNTASTNFSKGVEGEIESFHMFTNNFFRETDFDQGAPLIQQQDNQDILFGKPEGLFEAMTKSWRPTPEGWKMIKKHNGRKK